MMCFRQKPKNFFRKILYNLIKWCLYLKQIYVIFFIFMTVEIALKRCLLGCILSALLIEDLSMAHYNQLLRE